MTAPIVSEFSFELAGAWLPGTWHVRARHTFVRLCQNEMIQMMNIFTFSDWLGTATLEREQGVVACRYALNNADGEAAQTPVDFAFSLRSNANGKEIVGEFWNDMNGPAQPGKVLPSSLHFASEFQDACVFWKPFYAMFPDAPFGPIFVSIALQRVTRDSWLLDVCFKLPNDNAAEEIPRVMVLRSEYWHFHNPVKRPAPAPEIHLLESIDDALLTTDDLETDIDVARDELEDLITAVESARDGLEVKMRALDALKQAATETQDEIKNAGEEFSNAILDQHFELMDGGVSALDGLDGESVVHALAAFETLEGDVDYLSSDAEELGEGVGGITDEVIFSHWTNHGYTLGQRILREHGDNTNVDTSFLGPFQDRVQRLSSDSQKILDSSLRLLDLFQGTEALNNTDRSAVIGSMSKCCERIFSDVFSRRKDDVRRHQTVASILKANKRERKWRLEMPAYLSRLELFNPGQVFETIKNDPIKWSGPGRCAYAIAVFGGHISIVYDNKTETLDLLGTSNEDECVRELPTRLFEFQQYRNGFVHHAGRTHHFGPKNYPPAS